MSLTEPTPPDPQSAGFERCEQCNAPVDRDQRYCVNCGNHRRHVPDPAAKYMSRVTAHTARAGGASGVPGTVLAQRSIRRSAWGGLGLLGALALALIPVAAVVGVAIGRSSNNQDGRLINALEKQRAQVTTTLVNSSGTAASSSSSASAATTAKSTKTKTKKKTSSAASKSKTSTKSTPNGAVSKISGSKVTSQDQQKGTAEAKKIQSSTGSSYVQGADNLPSSVVVGP